jgi:hypothetical protein
MLISISIAPFAPIGVGKAYLAALRARRKRKNEPHGKKIIAPTKG